MKKGFVVAVVLLLVSVMSFGSLLDDIQKRGVLRVGQDASFMPLYGTDEKGDRIGLEVEILEKMADVLGVRLEFVVVNWDGIIPALLSGKFDIIWSAMTITPERAVKVNFAGPYMTSGQVILYNTKKFAVEPTYEELLAMGKDLKLSVQLGSTGSEVAREKFPDLDPLVFDTIDEAAYQVASGRADVMVFDSVYSRFMAKKYVQLGVSSYFFDQEDFGVAIKKGDFDTLQWLNTFINWMRTTGKLDELQEKWFEDYNPEF